MIDFKNIHIGSLIRQRADELSISIAHICGFFKYNPEQIEKMYLSESVETKELLLWSRLLEYDFFRLYTQNLVLYYPRHKTKIQVAETALPRFRKSIYTREIIEYILELIRTKEKTSQQIIDEYKIPKTTLHKWIVKYNEQE